MDIVYMDGKKENNDNFKFCLAVIDCFSKFAYVFPMKQINQKEVILHLRTLFSKAKNIPEKVQSDRGQGN